MKRMIFSRGKEFAHLHCALRMFGSEPRLDCFHRLFGRLFRGDISQDILDIHLIDKNGNTGAQRNRQHQTHKSEKEIQI